MDKIELYDKKKNCCGCSACMNICPKNAISMEEDEYGFIYPNIDKNKCINCGLCKKVCAYQKDIEKVNILQTYAAISNKQQIINTSSSGGIFASLAEEFILDGGIVYGCSIEKNNNELEPKHIRIDKVEEIKKLQGSKYVKSIIDLTYRNIKKDLQENKKVLFSGTPCQVAALKSYINISNVDSSQLFCIDIICHGTPSTKMFKDYLKYIENKYNSKIINITFRNKKYKVDYCGTFFIKKRNGKSKEMVFYNKISSYYNYFLKSKISRENCYSCKYANSNRTGEITIGDFWGIEISHPNYIKNKGGIIDKKKGVSCLLINNDKGNALVSKYGKQITSLISDYNRISRFNNQLNAPCKKPNDRNRILNLYKKYGFESIEKDFKKNNLIKYYLFTIYSKILNIVNKK